MAKHLLTCGCGRQHTVETRQAGESISCDCGATLPVPTLRQLRQLPEARGEPLAAGGPAWGARQATITVSLLLATVCLAIAAMSRMSEKPVPELDPVAYGKNVDFLISNMTPLQAWERWIDNYEPLKTSGFIVFKHPDSAAMQTDLDWHRWIQRAALGLAALFGVLAAGMWFAGGSRAKVG